MPQGVNGFYPVTFVYRLTNILMYAKSNPIFGMRGILSNPKILKTFADPQVAKRSCQIYDEKFKIVEFSLIK